MSDRSGGFATLESGAEVEYAKYLQSDAWRRTRKAVLQRDGHRCRACSSARDLHVHHRTYERVGHEDLDDLITLCEKHHGLVHRVSQQRNDLPLAHVTDRIVAKYVRIQERKAAVRKKSTRPRPSKAERKRRREARAIDMRDELVGRLNVALEDRNEQRRARAMANLVKKAEKKARVQHHSDKTPAEWKAIRLERKAQKQKARKAL